MWDENLIATLEQSLRQTRNAQNRLMARLRDVESEAERLREEIGALEKSAQQTESAIDSLLVSLRSENRSSPVRNIRFEDDLDQSDQPQLPSSAPYQRSTDEYIPRRSESKGSVAYINQSRGVPSRNTNIEAISHRFADRTITQACTLLLREAGKPIHVNELYNLLVAGGMKFKGNNPTISVAVSLSRNRRFRKVAPGTFDLVIRDAQQIAS